MSKPQTILSLPTGIHVVSEGPEDNRLIHEIWGNGEYKQAVQLLMDLNINRSRVVVDLGANRGYFSLYVIHQLRTAGLPYELLCVEGSLENYEKLSTRVNDEDTSLIHGLIGHKSGYGKISLYEDFHACHAVTDIVKPVILAPTEKVPYINLNNCLCGPIDLLKVDIEGSEERFLRNYPRLLKNTNILVIEFHPLYCDDKICRKLIKSAGLVNNIKLDRPGVEIFTK